MSPPRARLQRPRTTLRPTANRNPRDRPQRSLQLLHPRTLLRPSEGHRPKLLQPRVEPRRLQPKSAQKYGALAGRRASRSPTQIMTTIMTMTHSSMMIKTRTMISSRRTLKRAREDDVMITLRRMTRKWRRSSQHGLLRERVRRRLRLGQRKGEQRRRTSMWT